jgi:hypothetical protein
MQAVASKITSSEHYLHVAAIAACVKLQVEAQRSRLSGQMTAEALPQPGHDL